MQFKECAETANSSCADVSFPLLNPQRRSTKLSDYLNCFPGCVCGHGKAILSNRIIQNFESTKRYDMKLSGKFLM